MLWSHTRRGEGQAPNTAHGCRVLQMYGRCRELIIELVALAKIADEKDVHKVRTRTHYSGPWW
jgi:hypothetical protein